LAWLGGWSFSDIKANIKTALKSAFRPEFLNRIDEIVTFNRLSEKHMPQICKIMLKKVKSRALKINIKVNFDKSAVAQLAREGYDSEYGARALRRVISTKIEDMLADKVLAGKLSAGDDIRVVFNKNRFAAEKKTSFHAAERYGQNDE
jgi:ATP-dependent Clp protease ATP-binding subunit ClpC